MKKTILLSVAAAMLLMFNGCASKEVEYFKSVAVKTADFDANATAPVAVDFMDFIASYHPAAMTTFLLDPASKSSNFLSSMETQLRQRGYGMTYDKGVETAIPLAWKADPIDDSKNRIRVTFNIGSGNVSRQYILNPDNKLYYPIGMFTVHNLGKKYYDDLTEPEHNTIIMQPIIEGSPKKCKTTDNLMHRAVVKVDKDSVLNIRSFPTTEAEIIGQLRPNTEIFYNSVIMSSEKGKWIKLEKGIRGFVSAKFVEE